MEEVAIYQICNDHQYLFDTISKDEDEWDYSDEAQSYGY